MQSQTPRISKGLRGLAEIGAARGGMKEAALKEFPSHRDGPRAASDLELAEGSRYQLAVTGFLEDEGRGRPANDSSVSETMSPRTQSCMVAPGWPAAGVSGGTLPLSLPPHHPP